MGFYIGIDGGGTKTRCVLADDTEVLATAVSGGCNIVRLGEERASEALHAVIRQVCEAAQILADRVDSVCIGAAGAARPEIAAKIRNIVGKIGLQSNRVEVVADAAIALEAAFGEGPGVIAIAGTGSIIYGRDASGQTARAGGWGFAISDEGSGHWIGRQAISSLLRVRDEGPETVLTKLILAYWKLDSIDALIRHVNGTPPPDFPRLFRIVVAAAEKGDQVARQLLAAAGIELGGLAEIVVRRISPSFPYVPVAITGSVFRQSEDVRRVFYNKLEGAFPGIRVLDDLVEPVNGALALARRAGCGK